MLSRIHLQNIFDVRYTQSVLRLMRRDLIESGAKMYSRQVIIDQLATHYYYFLSSLPFDNEDYIMGMQEARSKFIANFHITIVAKSLPKPFKDRRYGTDFVSESALRILRVKQHLSDESGPLQYEHMIPKGRYIKDYCEQLAKENQLTVDLIREVLDKYLWTATITSSEDQRLTRTKMPMNWDQSNIKARYDAAGIELLSHDKSYLY